jgi:hypothetical protein
MWRTKAVFVERVSLGESGDDKNLSTKLEVTGRTRQGRVVVVGDELRELVSVRLHVPDLDFHEVVRARITNWEQMTYTTERCDADRADIVVGVKSLAAYQRLLKVFADHVVDTDEEDVLCNAMRTRGIRLDEWIAVNTDWGDLASDWPHAIFNRIAHTRQRELTTMLELQLSKRNKHTQFTDIPHDIMVDIIQRITSECVDARHTVLRNAVMWKTVHSLVYTNSALRDAVLEDIERLLPLSTSQFDVFASMVFGRGSVCCLGSAGTGKSHTCKVAIKVLRASGKSVAATAPTRRTAAALAGTTLAKFLGTRPRDLDERYDHNDIFVPHAGIPGWIRARNPGLSSGMEELLDRVRTYRAEVVHEPDPIEEMRPTDDEVVPNDPKPWLPILYLSNAEEISMRDVIVVDEVFMLSPFRSEQFRSVVSQYCIAFDRPMPRFIFLGDPWQTPPFTTDKLAIDPWHNRTFFFESPWFASLFRDTNGQFKNIFELTDVKRSDDPIFHKLLFNLRTDKPLSEDDVRLWHSHTARTDSPRIGTSLPKDWNGNALPVALIGRRGPRKYAQDPRTEPCIQNFEQLMKTSTEIEWAPEYVSIDYPLNGEVPRRLPRTVRVALGLMVTIPDNTVPYGRARLHGRVVATHRDEIHVKTLTGKVIKLRRTSDSGHGRRVQFDIKLASALTVHSTQGMTISDSFAAYIEDGAMWDRNMVYTALSRSTSLSLITLCGSMRNISCNVKQSLLRFQEELTAHMARMSRRAQPVSQTTPSTTHPPSPGVSLPS